MSTEDLNELHDSARIQLFSLIGMLFKIPQQELRDVFPILVESIDKLDAEVICQQILAAAQASGLPCDTNSPMFKRFYAGISYLTGNAFFDEAPFRCALAEKFADARISDTLKPIVLFSIETPSLKNRLKEPLADSLAMGGIVPEQYCPTDTIFSTMDGQREHAKNLFLRDAVYASSAAFELFPPAQFEYDNMLKSFIDGDKDDFSTPFSTAKMAMQLWPDDEIELYVFGFAQDDGLRQIQSTDSTVANSLKAISVIPQLPQGTKFDPTDSSPANFAYMREQAEEFMASSAFTEIVVKLASR
jgi:hypothetical protein